MSFLNPAKLFTKFQSTTIITPFSKNPHRTTTLSADTQFIQIHANRDAYWNKINPSVKLPVLTLGQEFIQMLGDCNPTSTIFLTKLDIKVSSFLLTVMW